MKNPTIPVICGPTASGKTSVAIEASRAFNGEIISADSHQVYRFMDIGTAKPTKDEQESCPHHLIDIVDPDKDYNASSFAEDALIAIEEILARNKSPIIVGGSGLYIKALVEGFFESGEGDAAVREKWEIFLRKNTNELLHKELVKIDPDEAAKIHPNNTRRIMRALEIFETTGKSKSEMIKSQKKSSKSSPYNFKFFFLDLDRDVLYKRIDNRVLQMVEMGLLDEVKGLLRSGYGAEHNSMSGIGYKEVLDHLEGKISIDEMLALIQQHTRNFAKRQVTWFRKEGYRKVKKLDILNFRSL